MNSTLDPVTSFIKRPIKQGIEKINQSISRGASLEEIISGVECPVDDEGNRIIIRVRHLSKIFGKSPEKALPLLEKGMAKDEILKTAGNTVGVYDVSFDVKEGEIFVLMGLSGSGKSTLERCLNRLIEPTSGEILIEGLDILNLDPDELRTVRRKKFSMVFQEFGLLPHRDVKSNVAYGLEIQGVPEKERLQRAKEAIQIVGLSGYEDMMPDNLSGGMKQRVGLARALATDPDILLMDEAFSALDPLIRKDMQDELLKIQNALSKTIVFVSHDLDEALKLGDRIALMKDGKIIQIGTAEEILQSPADEYVSRFVEDVDRTKILTAGIFMRRPREVIHITQGPRTALRVMEEADMTSIFVVDRQRRLMGMVEADDAVRAVKTEKPLQSIINTEIPTVGVDTPMSQVIQTMVTTNYPIPVVDDNKVLLGVVSPSAAAKAIDMGSDVNGL